jgi:hypothetical protein
MNIHNFLVAVALVLISSLTINAQNLRVENASVIIDDTQVPAVKVVMNPAPKKVKEAFRDYISDRYDVKMKGIGFLSNKDVLTAEGVQIPTITYNDMDLKAKIVENGDNTEMYVVGTLGYDVNISPDSYRTEYRAMKNITVNFLNEFLPEYYQERVDETQDMLSDLIDNRNDLRDDLKDNKDKIAELEKENRELSTEITSVEAKIQEAEMKLDNRRDNLQKVNRRLNDVGDK